MKLFLVKINSKYKHIVAKGLVEVATAFPNALETKEMYDKVEILNHETMKPNKDENTTEDYAVEPIPFSPYFARVQNSEERLGK